MTVHLEGPRPLSRSVLWRSLRGFYDAQGPAAFTSGTVPWRITSCPLLADAYADAVEAFASDAGGAVQVLELGGGTGRMAFHLLKALDERGVRYHYLFTDASPSTVSAAADHPQLQRWLERGQLGCKRLDALEPGALDFADGPVVVVANYLFDSLPHDAWRAQGGRAVAQDVEVQAPALDAPLEQIAWTFSDAPGRCAPPVEGYAARVGTGRFLWPVGAVAALNAVSRAIGRPHLWLISDKGPSRLEQVTGHDTVQLAKHGCISALVNFDALRAWAGWRPFLGPSQPDERFGTYALVQGTRAVPRLRQAWERTVGPNLPLRAVELFEQLDKAEPGLTELLRALAFTRFDPDNLLELSARLRARVSGEISAAEGVALVAALDACWSNYFALKEPNDLAFEIATLLHRAGQLSHAETYYRHSVLEWGAHAATFFNLALCLLDLGRISAAREALQRTLGCEPGHVRARELLAATA